MFEASEIAGGPSSGEEAASDGSFVVFFDGRGIILSRNLIKNESINLNRRGRVYVRTT
jgi:hypothetical protein